MESFDKAFAEAERLCKKIDHFAERASVATLRKTINLGAHVGREDGALVFFTPERKKPAAVIFWQGLPAWPAKDNLSEYLRRLAAFLTIKLMAHEKAIKSAANRPAEVRAASAKKAIETRWANAKKEQEES